MLDGQNFVYRPAGNNNKDAVAAALAALINADPLFTASSLGTVVTIHKVGDTDRLNVFDRADTSANVGTLRAQTITGLGMSSLLNYTDFENLQLNLSNARDELFVESTTPASPGSTARAATTPCAFATRLARRGSSWAPATTSSR